MSTHTQSEDTNIAETIIAHLPKPTVIGDTEVKHGMVDVVQHVAVPSGFTLQAIDMQDLLPAPRRTKAVATLSEASSFVDYVLRHAQGGSVVWCDFNPKTYKLGFRAVIDEHDEGMPGWRAHQAQFTPMMSAEWDTWTGLNRKPQDQVPFAEFIEANEKDFAAIEGMPTSLQMLTMATEFVARQDMKLKSNVRLQNGGVNLVFVDDSDAETTAAMKLFEKFALGIPVFWQTPKEGEAITGHRLDARLKYRAAGGKVTFHFELIRPDLVHQRAALALIAEIKAGIGATPLLMGSCT